MKLTRCFGGAAAVADEAVVVARQRSRRQRRGMRFLGRFLSAGRGKGDKGKESPGRLEEEVEDIYGMIARRAAKSVPSSSPLSSSASLDSACSSSSSSSSSSSYSCSSSRSSSFSASSFLEATPPPPAKQPAEKRSPAGGAAAVLLCLVLLVFCGRFAATLLTPVAFYLIPRRWPARAAKAESVAADGAAAVSPVASCREEEATKRKVVREGFLVRNQNK